MPQRPNGQPGGSPLTEPVHPPHVFGGACQLTDVMGLAFGFVQTGLFGHGPWLYAGLLIA